MQELKAHYTRPVQNITRSDCETLIKLALEEDAPNGDPTSESIFNPEDQAQATVISRENGVLCGKPIIAALIEIYQEIHSCLFEIEFYYNDGDQFSIGDRILHLSGPTRAILRIERILLNFIQYLSGISTSVAKTAAAAGKHLIVDTRKTLPGYRKLVKYAVYCGGGINHRINLSDMILIKDNHIAAAGGVETAITRARQLHPDLPLEIEVETMEDLKKALPLQPDYIMLDNMDAEEIGRAMELIKPFQSDAGPKIEISGGWHPDRLHQLEKLDPLRVSMGFLTGETRLIDFSMEIVEN